MTSVVEEGRAHGSYYGFCILLVTGELSGVPSSMLGFHQAVGVLGAEAKELNWGARALHPKIYH